MNSMSDGATVYCLDSRPPTTKYSHALAFNLLRQIGSAYSSSYSYLLTAEGFLEHLRGAQNDDNDQRESHTDDLESKTN